MSERPAPEDFRHPSEVLIKLLTNIDDQGRAMFTAYWLDAFKASGVAGQVFRTNLQQFELSERARGNTVRIWRKSK